MNIIMYNFDNVDAEELSEFSEKVNSSIYFALSLSEVSGLLTSNKMEIAILKILDDSEIALLKAIIIGNPKTEFFVNNVDNLQNEYSAEPRIHISMTNYPLTKIAKQILN
ncbi:MAG: hypothetical protein K8S23_03225 [Candidatus Cloacimonetes bacterium]|nr:hypothetical protein [Candidatus Cloacimonadota bacterium]